MNGGKAAISRVEEKGGLRKKNAQRSSVWPCATHRLVDGPSRRIPSRTTPQSCRLSGGCPHWPVAAPRGRPPSGDHDRRGSAAARRGRGGRQQVGQRRTARGGSRLSVGATAGRAVDGPTGTRARCRQRHACSRVILVHHRVATLLPTRFVAKPHHPVADAASSRRRGRKPGGGCNHRSTSRSGSVMQPSKRARAACVRD